jgi:single-stranded-DNA-specific exonuclease
LTIPTSQVTIPLMNNRPVSIPVNQWRTRPAAPDSLRQQLPHLHPVLAQILYNRGLTDPATAQAFMERRYLPSVDPFLLADMETAVNRIFQAIENDEIIIVYGDFDADGVTSTVLLVEALRKLGLSRQQVRPYIPDRVDEGYGLNKEALTTLKERGAGLVISVDCGIRSVAEVEHASEIGLDMIVTDHHSIGKKLPPAVAVINPKRPDSAYPELGLAGVGIAFKLAQALRLRRPNMAQFSDEDLLDLVAIGTVADLAPLQGENRKLVHEGLAVLNDLKRPGLAALAAVAGARAGQISAESIAFGFGPRINAAGRLSHAYAAARLLAAPDSGSARELAQQLNQLNQKRQRITAELGELAEGLITDGERPILIAAHRSFVSGVVGLVASRLAEKYYRPAVVMEMGETESRASCRSIPEFHITQALDQVADLLERHGGHAQAAGFTILNENLPAFEERLTAVAAEQLAGKELLPTITADAEIGLREVDWAFYESLQQLEPTGAENPSPLFMSRRVQVLNCRAVGADGAHLQIEVSDGRAGFKCIAFRQGAWVDCLPPLIDMIYSVNVNEWNGRRSLQLAIQDIREAEE